MIELLIFNGVGVFTGLSAGLLGIGGGLVSVPAMIFILPYFGIPSDIIMHIAIATSLALIIPTSMISAYGHYKNNAIVWLKVTSLLPGLITGACIGGYLVIHSDREVLQSFFSIFLILIALYMLLGKQSVAQASVSKKGLFPALIIGCVSSLMGVGGGTLTVPYLTTWSGVSMPKAIGTSAFCGLPISISGSLVFLFFSSPLSSTDNINYLYLPAFAGILIGVVFFAPIGARLTHSVNVGLLKKVFTLMLLVVAARLLFL